MSATHYASFGKRFVAVLIDGFILQIFSFIAFGKAPDPTNIDNPKAITYTALFTLLVWIYFASMESSLIQATFGKRLLGIIVTDSSGNKISFGRATARYFAKSFGFLIWVIAVIIGIMGGSTGDQNSPYFILAGLLFIIGPLVVIIGYLMAAFTPEKQALHDIISRCLVINGKGQSITIPWKTLIGLAIGAIIAGRLLAQMPEEKIIPTPIDPDPIPTPTEQSTPTEQPNPISNIVTNGNCSSRTDNIFKLELTEASGNINGNWKLEFSAGFVQHQALLSMQGSSGIMIVRLPNGEGGIQTIRQKMTLCSSAKGIVLLGEDPIDVDKNEQSTTYSPDNFIIAIGVDGEIFRNYSGEVESPVNREYLGDSTIGIEMIELTSEIRDRINQEPNIPFNINRDTGILITKVNSDSTAEKSGLQPGDIILSVNDQIVSQNSEVQELVKSSIFNSTLKMEIDRNGENRFVDVTAGCCVNPN